MANDEDHIEQPASEAAPADHAAADKPQPQDAPPNMPRPDDHPAHLPWPPEWREYPADHDACRKGWTPDKPFNDDWAREDFGDAFVDKLLGDQLYSGFIGDWWLLAMLMRCADSARLEEGDLAKESKAMEWWRRQLGPPKKDRITIHLESAFLTELHLNHADLRYARLDYATLHGTQLEYASLDGACLEGAKLNRARLNDAGLSRAGLSNADLSGAELRNAVLAQARLEHANLARARLEHADLKHARLKHADLRGARLEHANLLFARLEHANLSRARLEHASLLYARLEHAELNGARLDHADVRGAKGLLFDNNPVDRLHIEGNARDPWSRLRREYTGPRFFFHLLLLVAFLLPYAARVLILSAQSEMYTSAKKIAGDDPPEPIAEGDTTEHSVQNASVESAINGVEESSVEKWWRTGVRYSIKKFEKKHEPTPAWWLLVGGNRGWLYVALTAILVAYNGLRAILTSRVSMLRDAEERSKITPALRQYMWLYRLHWIAWVLLVCAVISFLYSAAAWIKETEVWVPKMVE